MDNTYNDVAVDVNGIISRNVRNYRLAKKMTCAKLAEDADISVDTLKRVEKGFGTSAQFMYQIAVALEVPIAELFPKKESSIAESIDSAVVILLKAKDRLPNK